MLNPFAKLLSSARYFWQYGILSFIKDFRSSVVFTILSKAESGKNDFIEKVTKWQENQNRTTFFCNVISSLTVQVIAIHLSEHTRQGHDSPTLACGFLSRSQRQQLLFIGDGYFFLRKSEVS